MTAKKVLVTLFAASLVLVLACSDDDPTEPSYDACSGYVIISAGGGLTPSFTWKPTCSVYTLVVSEVVGGGQVWSLSSSGQSNSINPGVKYGVVPSGASERFSPRNLVSGRRYIVTLTSDDFGGSGSYPSGSADFTP